MSFRMRRSSKYIKEKETWSEGIKIGLKNLIPGAHWTPSSNQNFNLFPFTTDIDKGKFGYYGFLTRLRHMEGPICLC